MNLLKAIIWAIITFFSPDAGLEEIELIKDKDNDKDNRKI